jgi:hypothetical protein
MGRQMADWTAHRLVRLMEHYWAAGMVLQKAYQKELVMVWRSGLAMGRQMPDWRVPMTEKAHWKVNH